MAKFVTIGERIHCISPVIRKAMAERDPEPILKRAKEQLDAGATYLDVNIGPAESDGEDLMKWAVQLLQSNFDNVPLALDTANKKAIEAGISVYNRAKGKPIVNSADAGGLSVLTAWAAGKLSSSTIAKYFAEADIEGKIKNRTLVIPGKVAVLKGEIEAKLPGWNVVVGPAEAVQLVKFLKDMQG